MLSSPPILKIFALDRCIMEEEEDTFHAKKVVDQYVMVRQLPDGTEEKVFMTIEKEMNHKPFLGGFRSKYDGTEFHHGSSQTDNAPPPVKLMSHLRNRDTQTLHTLSRSMQTYREAGTQMARNDLHVSTEGECVKDVGPYFTAAGLLAHKRTQAIIIQRHWRGYLARSLVWYLQTHRTQARLNALENNLDEQERRHDRERHERHRRMHPRTQGDFEVLYNELDQWVHKETQRAKQNAALDEHERQAVYTEILDKETKVLQTIDRLKTKASHEWKLDRQYRMMHLMALPKKWQMGDGEVNDVHTAHTIRAQELLDLYKALNTVTLCIEDRLDVLLHVKWTVSEFPCPLVKDIIDLIDREADLLNRGRRESSLEGLRQRLSNLFLDFIKTPSFNYEAHRFVRVQKHRVRPIFPILID